MLEEDEFDDRLGYSDGATFYVTGKVNKLNTRISGTEHSHAILEHVRDSPQVNVFCAISKKCVYGPFFLKEQRSTVRLTSLYAAKLVDGTFV